MLKIRKTRIRSLKKYTPFIQGKSVVLSIDINKHLNKVRKIGFSKKLQEGETVLPLPIGTISSFNAEGKEKIRKDLPMETHYRQIEWTWKQWCGRGQTREITEVRDSPYEKYPREFIEPPSIELKLAKNKITSPVFNYPKDEQLMLHTINLFLEVFGECEILNENLEGILKTPEKSLKWAVLPQGEIPWDKVKRGLEPALKRSSSQEKAVFQDRFDTINSYKPDFGAYGLAGFSGYVVFGFKKKNLYICESIWHGNAIYIFQEDWRKLSKKTKAEILRGNLHKERIIHYSDWKDKIDELLT
jgi:hypothetical protein